TTPNFGSSPKPSLLSFASGAPSGRSHFAETMPHASPVALWQRPSAFAASSASPEASASDASHDATSSTDPLQSSSMPLPGMSNAPGFALHAGPLLPGGGVVPGFVAPGSIPSAGGVSGSVGEVEPPTTSSSSVCVAPEH